VDAHDSIPSDVISAFALIADSARPVSDGHINRTWRVRDETGTDLILQRVNPVFPASVNETIDAVTRHLESRGLTTPRLLPSRHGRLWIETDGVWRVQTEVPGRTWASVESHAQAESAGRLLAQFHAALIDFGGAVEPSRAAPHDLDRHVRALKTALGKHRDHRHRSSIEPLAETLLDRTRELGPPPTMPPRIVHGDPKITNMLFAEDSGVGICLIDLDTLARMPLALELGDAFRSWCNDADEDAVGAQFSLSLFESAWRGYSGVAAAWIEPDEANAVATTTRRIAVELAVRFLTDALNESYFGWDSARFESASLHNQARARAQLDLADSIGAQAAAIQAITGSR
jgi:Ser/Thr protein kinase RdoA (MazF antagonist)